MNNHFPLSILFALICLFPFVSSCSKDNTASPESEDKKIRVVISHVGDIQYYKGLLTISGTLDNQQKKFQLAELIGMRK